MIQPLDAVVFSVYSNKGVYALLLGSGISRSAGIPTGWEVTLDLIRKLAASNGVDCGSSPADWYQKKYKEEANYSNLLRDLGRSSTERQQILRGYFEPSEDEREQGKKAPTQAHKAIAKLISLGYFRVIITTNFDRLIESALDGVGVAPTVISTPSQVKGALPLVHQKHLILKLHGDYLDPQIKNTEDELAAYDPKTKKFLAQILDNFGLIVCGWSAEYDTALYDSISSKMGRRFPMYWTSIETPTGRAKKLIQLTQANIVDIKSADSFFDTLAQGIESLAEFDRPHQLSISMAVESLKRFLVEERHRIRLSDLIFHETEKVLLRISDESVFSATELPSGASFVNRMKLYEATLGILESLISTGCFFGEGSQRALWIDCVKRIGNLPSVQRQSGIQPWTWLRYYCALRLFYAAGLAALAGGNLITLFGLMTMKLRPLASLSTEEEFITSIVNIQYVIDNRLYREGAGEDAHKRDHLHATLRDVLRRFCSDDQAYDEVFEQFEYLIAANQASLTGDRCLIPLGRLRLGIGPLIRLPEGIVRLEKEIERLGSSHPLLKAGFFGGSVENFRNAHRYVLEFAAGTQ